MSVIDLFETKAARMKDQTLLEEINLHLRALERGKVLDKAHKIRAMQLLTEAIKRVTLKEGHSEFESALRIIKLL